MRISRHRTIGRGMVMRTLDWRTDTVKDKVHPSPSGAKKMADRWLKALEPLLSAKK